LLGEYGLLPLLKGWEYKRHMVSRSNIVRGADPVEVLSLNETGWLYSVAELTTDTYGTMRFNYQGAELESKTLEVYPEAYQVGGAFSQDPQGWAQRYFRPNPYSTAGIYFIAALSIGAQGGVMPFVPTVNVNLYLPNNSTQNSAYILGDAIVIAITDKKVFVHSLRRILDPESSLKIDPALLTTGPAVLKQLGEEP